MPIDDAFEKIDDNKISGIKQVSVAHIDDSFASDVIKKYIKSFETFSNMNQLRKFDAKNIEKFSDFIRFDKYCRISFIGMKKEKLIELVEAKDTDAAYLIEKTDAVNITYPFFIQSEESYKNIPHFIKLKEILHYEDIHTFHSQTDGYFIIPNLEFLSYFIEDGEKFRKYIKITKIDQMHILTLIEGYSPNIILKNIENSFTTKNLRTFCEQTKTTTVKSMIDQVREIYSNMEASKIQKGNSIIREFLHSRLKQYNPQLVYEGA